MSISSKLDQLAELEAMAPDENVDETPKGLVDEFKRAKRMRTAAATAVAGTATNASPTALAKAAVAGTATNGLAHGSSHGWHQTRAHTHR